MMENITKKATLKLFEVYELHSELKGLRDPQTGEQIRKGLLDERLLVSIKYSLDNLVEILLKEIQKIEALKQEAIQKLGNKTEDGGYYIPMRINEIFDEEGVLKSYDINPNYIKYQEEIDELLKQECEVEYREITLDKLDIETEVNPHILFKLITSNQS